ncbi:unnamed protein product [Clonostachys solani]|uniref:Zn(2)-C6 fungal-type domain-containing protein n=1 Tax=Clonostachys solani TaxID=160281 RepID=A0A9P0ELY5_9HYPO|nr:unnamed protein product [Clonostachys solani]
MSVRLAACEPCRLSKLACNHERPVCSRCSFRGQGRSCTYRDRPFKRRERRNGTTPGVGRASPQSSISPPEQLLTTPRPHHYPNPGYLGHSSHSAIFNQVNTTDTSPGGDPGILPLDVETPLGTDDVFKDQDVAHKAIQALSQLVQMDVPNICGLLNDWVGRNVNLPLAEPFVPGSIEAARAFWELRGHECGGSAQISDQWVTRKARFLLRNSRRQIRLERDTTVSEYMAQIFDDSLRWEVLGIFFTAASRAALDTDSWPGLYSNFEEKRHLIKAVAYISDCCLEICLSLDCLNDLQAVLQYENLIVHSQVDGDQSYQFWRKIGDAASTFFALGFHEVIDENSARIPLFVAELRRAISARTYSADKKISVFLGRPPRIVKAHCTLQLPRNITDLWNEDAQESHLRYVNTNIPHSEFTAFDSLEKINYTADTRCSSLFSAIKEEIIELFRTRHSHDQVAKISSLQQAVENIWQSLPVHFKLSTSLRDSPSNSFERDFLVGTRLEYLHNLLLLDLISLKNSTGPSEALLAVAGEMLSYSVELIILRHTLVNSGTSLIWKISQYGLPAAAAVSLSLLNPATIFNSKSSSRSNLIQNLSIFVGEFKGNTFIQPSEPNYALFARATRTIQSILDAVLSSPLLPLQQQRPAPVSNDPTTAFTYYWDPWECENDFWANLAEHPNLLGS